MSIQGSREPLVLRLPPAGVDPISNIYADMSLN